MDNKLYTAKITARKEIAKDTYEVRLRVPADFHFNPGQYIWLILPKLLYDDPKGGRRAFSICSSPSEKEYISLVFRSSSSGFKRTLIEMPLDSDVTVAGPFGCLSFPQKQDIPVVIIAGGVGIAPFMSMIAADAEQKIPRNISLIYLNSEKEKVVYADGLTNIQSANSSNFTVKYINGSLDWEFVQSFIKDMRPVVWYVIGPKDMVYSVGNNLLDHGIDENRIVFEEFYISHEKLKASIEKMESSIEIFQLAVENSFNHIVLTDVDGQIVFVNHGAEIVTGFSKSEMIGQTPRLWGGLMDKTFYINLWHTIKVEKKPFEGEVKNRRKNGELYTALARISPIFDKQKIVIGFMGTEEDITIRVQAQENLEKSNKSLEDTKQAMLNILDDLKHTKETVERENEKNKTILRSFGEALVVTDGQGNIEMVNQSFEKLTGWKQSEVIGKDMLEVLPKIDEKGNPVPREHRSLYKILTSQAKISQTSTLVNTHSYILKNGSTLPIMGVVTSIIYNNQLIGAVQIFHDISKEKEVDKIKDEFLSLASHELRTPLTAIDGLVSMILDGEYGPLNNELKQPLEDVNSSSERLIRLVNDLLNLSRIQAGRLKYTLSEFEISDVIKQIVELIKPISKNKNVELKIGNIDRITVQADSDKVKQALHNLIGNAIKFTDKGSIEVSSKINKDFMEISIADTGIGIAKEDQSKLFGKFQMLGPALGRPQGTGIGLYLSRELVRKMGGDLWLGKSEVGKGSIFIFSLPLAGSQSALKSKLEIEKEASVTQDQKSDTIK